MKFKNMQPQAPQNGNAIRKAEFNDFEEIMRIWKAENIKAHSFIPPEYWEQNFESVKNALPQAEIYVFTDNGEIAGFIGLNGDYIEGLFVKENQQRKGVGSALLNEIKAFKSALTLNVYKKNINAVKFYQKNDFTVIAEGTDECTGECDCTMQWKYVKK